ncbi:hypothetical protein ACIRRA_06190 [Nocardia sp. NPDC101769]|uniref:hypothetical protein n=1 Tax=Nocardia sp. NPDC101769 TaxID=3364333 RepID=UPI00382C3F5F
MNRIALQATAREMLALIEQINGTWPVDEARALSDAARAYAGKGVILEVAARADEAAPGNPDEATPGNYDSEVRGWRKPLRLLLIAEPGSDAGAERAYDDWAHWIAGGGLLALRDADALSRRVAAGGKFRELAAVGALRILQRIAACN